MFRKESFVVIAALLLFQFSYAQKLKTVALHYAENDGINFDNDLIDFRLYPLDEFPSYNKFITEKYKGIPTNDSIRFYSNSIHSTNFYYRLYKGKFYSKEDFVNLIADKSLDTTGLSKIKLPESLVILCAFHKDKQILIADVNRNKDFSDDIRYEYDINYRNNPFHDIAILNSKKASSYSYETIDNGSIKTINRRLVLYPDTNSTFAYDGNAIDREYYALLRFKDFWKGDLVINNTQLEIYLFASFGNYKEVLYVKPSHDPFSKTDINYNNQYFHKVYERINIAGSTIKVDSVAGDFSKIYLNTESNTSPYGTIVGSVIQDFDYTNLENKVSKSAEIINDKQYTLIDFWGTWCEPCIELTPKIKELFNKHCSKLNILSIAVDENVFRVKNYISKNKIPWQNGFILHSNVQNDPIMKNLNMQYFPSFILVDNKGKIILRGSAETLDKIIDYLNSNK